MHGFGCHVRPICLPLVPMSRIRSASYANNVRCEIDSNDAVLLVCNHLMHCKFPFWVSMLALWSSHPQKSTLGFNPPPFDSRRSTAVGITFSA